MSHVLWVTKHLSRLHFTAGTCWLLLSTLDRGGDGDCLLDSEFSLVTGHTFLASIGSHIARGVRLSETFIRLRPQY